MILNHFIFTLFFVLIDVHIGTTAIIAKWIHPHIATTMCTYFISHLAQIIIGCTADTTILTTTTMSPHIILMLQPTVVEDTSLL